MGDLLFQRQASVTVATVKVDYPGLDFAFTVKKSLRPEPNTAEVHIINLNRDHRSQLEELTEVPVQIEAGYKDATSVLFLGNLRRAISMRDGANIITSISSGDGEKELRKARVNVALIPGTTTDQVLRLVALSLGVGTGNLDKAISTLNFSTVGNLFTKGTVLSGNAAREMSNLCRSVGLTWSVQNGKLQILPLGQALQGTAIKLTPSTGLVGTPSVDNKGLLKAHMLMAPDVFPGRLLVLESERLTGQFRIETTEHKGDTAGQDWYVDIEGKRF